MEAARLAEAELGGFRGGVVGLAGVAVGARDGGDEDDGPVLADLILEAEVWGGGAEDAEGSWCRAVVKQTVSTSCSASIGDESGAPVT